MTEEQITSICEQELLNALERIRAVGPDHVVVDRTGLAVRPSDAAVNGIAPDVVFIRNDGWSLGAPDRLQKVAHAIWARYWIARYDVRTGAVDRYEEVPY